MRHCCCCCCCCCCWDLGRIDQLTAEFFALIQPMQELVLVSYPRWSVLPPPKKSVLLLFERLLRIFHLHLLHVLHHYTNSSSFACTISICNELIFLGFRFKIGQDCLCSHNNIISQCFCAWSFSFVKSKLRSPISLRMPNKSLHSSTERVENHSGTRRIKLMTRRAACTESKEAAATAASFATKLRNKTNERTNERQREAPRESVQCTQ